MSKKLEEMSLEELWQLFPIILRQHDPVYRQWYEQETKQLCQLLTGAVRRISHIGSTAVPNLVAKPTIDILLEVGQDVEPEHLIKEIRAAGWLVMSTAESPMKLVFNKGYTETGFAEKVFHLHVRHYGDWDELYFRDYLLAHPEVAQAYGELKRELAKNFRHNRDAYTLAETSFIAEVTKLARAEFGSRYAVNEEADAHLHGGKNSNDKHRSTPRAGGLG